MKLEMANNTNNHFFQNIYVLSIGLVALTYILDFILSVSLSFWEMETDNLFGTTILNGLLSGQIFFMFVFILASFGIGLLYTYNFNEIMPKILRKKVAFIYAFIQVILGLIAVWTIVPWGIIIILLSLMHGFIGYFFLGYSGKIYLRVTGVS